MPDQGHESHWREVGIVSVYFYVNNEEPVIDLIPFQYPLPSVLGQEDADSGTIVKEACRSAHKVLVPHADLRPGNGNGLPDQCSC